MIYVVEILNKIEQCSYLYIKSVIYLDNFAALMTQWRIHFILSMMYQFNNLTFENL